jgi:hypothetical protein
MTRALVAIDEGVILQDPVAEHGCSVDRIHFRIRDGGPDAPDRSIKKTRVPQSGRNSKPLQLSIVKNAQRHRIRKVHSASFR